MRLKAPYPWFGGKARIASVVWSRFGHVRNYVEPFAGSLAVLLARPEPVGGVETVNDVNGWLCNFWRSLQADPAEVARYAEWPVSELDLHARGDWLFYRPGVAEWVERMRADPNYYDAKSAGWWVWGQCCWIGSGWGVEMREQRKERQLPHLGDAGQGVNRKLPHLGDAWQGDEPQTPIAEYLHQLAERVKKVRVCCGDWSRVCGPSVTFKHGTTAVFLDPPYAVADRHDCYEDDDRSVANDVRAWCRENGTNRDLRIALCGYEGEHEELESLGWDVHVWKAKGGFDGQRRNGTNDNRKRERVWCSPGCVQMRTPDLFGGTP